MNRAERRRLARGQRKGGLREPPPKISRIEPPPKISRIKGSQNPEGATLHPHPERWGRLQGCVLCLATNVPLRSHAHELWCGPCLEKAAGHIARIAGEAREMRKHFRLSHREKARRRAEFNNQKRTLRHIVGERDNWTCQNPECKRPSKEDAHIDHIRPLAFGGTNDPDNLQILCPNCNFQKAAMPSPRSKRDRLQAMANATGSLLMIDPDTGSTWELPAEA